VQKKGVTAVGRLVRSSCPVVRDLVSTCIPLDTLRKVFCEGCWEIPFQRCWSVIEPWLHTATGQSTWLWIQRSGFDSRCYKIFWEVAGLERGPLNLASTAEELLEIKSSGSGLEIRGHGRGDPPRCLRDTVYPQKLALTSPKNGGHLVGIVRSRTQSHGVCNEAEERRWWVLCIALWSHRLSSDWLSGTVWQCTEVKLYPAALTSRYCKAHHYVYART
jgi:hypothetical protein